MARRLVPILATLVALMVAPAFATAAQRYARPDGSGAACSSANPCDIVTAINGAGAGDEVILTGQDYGSAGSPLTTALQTSQPNVNVHGEAGQPRPRIFTSTADHVSGLDLSGAGAKASHLEVHQVAGGSNQVALTLDADAKATDIVARNTASGGKACTLLANSVLMNSVCEATGSSGRGIFPFRTTGSPQGNNAIIRNVTAIGTEVGIGVRSGVSPGTGQDIKVTNSIARGGFADVEAYRDIGGQPAKLTLDHSNWGLQNHPNGAQIVEGANNQRSVAANFVGPGDYHQAPGSPTIDRGANSPLNGDTDFDGDPRILGGTTDIGADEFVPGSPGGGPDGPGGTQDTVLPIARDLRVTPRNVQAASSGDSIQAATGAQVTYTLSELGLVTFTVERATIGRKKGKKCVRQTRANRKRKRCTRYVKVKGSFNHAAVAGPNRFRFTGRLNNRALKLGSYRLVGTPKDIAGNTGKAVTAKFKIVKK